MDQHLILGEPWGCCCEDTVPRPWGAAADGVVGSQVLVRGTALPLRQVPSGRPLLHLGGVRKNPHTAPHTTQHKDTLLFPPFHQNVQWSAMHPAACDHLLAPPPLRLFLARAVDPKPRHRCRRERGYVLQPPLQPPQEEGRYHHKSRYSSTRGRPAL